MTDTFKYDPKLKDGIFQSSVKWLLQSHGYRVIPCDSDTILRELAVNSEIEMMSDKIHIPEHLIYSADFFVMTKCQTEVTPVVAEVYDTIEEINVDRLKKINKHYPNVIYIFFVKNPPASKIENGHNYPSYNIRVLANSGDEFDFIDCTNGWWGLKRMQDIFGNLRSDESKTITEMRNLILGIN